MSKKDMKKHVMESIEKNRGFITPGFEVFYDELYKGIKNMADKNPKDQQSIPNIFRNAFEKLLKEYNWCEIWDELDLYDPCSGKNNKGFPINESLVRQEGLFKNLVKKHKKIDIAAINRSTKKILFFEDKFTARSESILSALHEFSLIDVEKLVIDGEQYEPHLFLLSYFAGGQKKGTSARKNYVFFDISKELYFKKYINSNCKFLLLDANIHSMRDLDTMTKEKILNNQQEFLEIVRE